MQTNQPFVVAPTEEELRGLGRRLQFIPSTTEALTALTPQQVNRFNTDGFVQQLSVFSPAEIAEHREYFDKLLNDVLDSGGDAYSISSAHLTFGPVYDLLLNPTIVYVKDLLGPDVIGWGSHYFCKLPGDEKAVDWHQDASYWPLSHTHAVTVWLAIDDADVENGCMQFVKGSHLKGHVVHEINEQTAEGVLGRGIVDVQAYGEIVDNPVAAGNVSIHSDLLIHSSKPNRSSRRRCGLTLRYCSADVRASMGWHQKGVVVCGSDGSSHWSNPGRPSA